MVPISKLESIENECVQEHEKLGRGDEKKGGMGGLGR